MQGTRLRVNSPRALLPGPSTVASCDPSPKAAFGLRGVSHAPPRPSLPENATLPITDSIRDLTKVILFGKRTCSLQAPTAIQSSRPGTGLLSWLFRNGGSKPCSSNTLSYRRENQNLRQKKSLHCSCARTGSWGLHGASSMQNSSADMRGSRCDLITRRVYKARSPGHDPPPTPELFGRLRLPVRVV
jgi:hypothetical protein